MEERLRSLAMDSMGLSPLNLDQSKAKARNESGRNYQVTLRPTIKVGGVRFGMF